MANGKHSTHGFLMSMNAQGMYCKLCCKFDTKNRQNQVKLWNIEAHTTICKDILARHETSMMHREAL